MAVAGGIGLTLTPNGNIQLANLTFLNPDGHSRSFSDDAGGYGRGEGASILILKRLDKALREGDPIRAGTGTPAGDPLKAGAIYRTIGSSATKSRKLLIGSFLFKTNSKIRSANILNRGLKIRYLEAAAGVAGIIKGILRMENGLIPPNIYFNKPNPAILWKEWNMKVPSKLTPWPVCKTKRMSVSGFGMGGTNGHIVLESFNPNNWTDILPANGVSRVDPSSKKRLFVFSSHDQAGFKRIAEKLVGHLDGFGPAASSPGFLANISYTLATAKSGLT
ncbi:uncharacterized protein PgNI_02617 [Pyricularia grisea]|uniref:Ketosynthase family 3 (KS3) domain-containing protein n=1 Tax=Pyricularia grisea TaxID=148305 RepID=A0A6P8BLY2_PYRGI|nr:uncharacterized protein PgNI_02617 [Pyricularia grisea]TLD17607.1 hypothetical protein PgNI_02617 [Pyricularia grisea]